MHGYEGIIPQLNCLPIYLQVVAWKSPSEKILSLRLNLRQNSAIALY